jgi:hypothetical protein
MSCPERSTGARDRSSGRDGHASPRHCVILIRRVAVPELPLGASGTVKDELLVRSVVDPVGVPTFGVVGQPYAPALFAKRDEGDLLGAHGSILESS